MGWKLSSDQKKTRVFGQVLEFDQEVIVKLEFNLRCFQGMKNIQIRIRFN